MTERKDQEEELKRLEALLSSAEVLKNSQKYANLSKAHKKLQSILQKYEEADRIIKEINNTSEILDSAEPEIKELAENELTNLKERLAQIESEIDMLANPAYDEYQKNCIVEIRAGAGGSEASLFAADLFRMYVKFLENQGLKYEILSSHPSEIGGYKEIIFLISGDGAYRQFRFEKGVHRVQRIPVTEAGGRIHTSTVTVAVLPEVEESQITINADDLRIDTFRAGGHGGQNVNKVSSAVRITHLASGIVVTCQDERSQHRNREKAMKILRARLMALEEAKKSKRREDQRRQQIGTGERSEKIRTYNYPQNRLTDHRIGLSLYNLQKILDGEMAPLITALEKYERANQKGQRRTQNNNS